MTKPCSNCPFTKTCTPRWLGEHRVMEILKSESFACHKTTDSPKGRKQCAGFMLIKNGTSAFEELADILGHKLTLEGRETVFETEQDCINHHTNKK